MSSRPLVVEHGEFGRQTPKYVGTHSFLRQLVDLSPLAALVLDSEGRTVEANADARHLLGDAISTSALPELFHPRDAARVATAIEHAFAETSSRRLEKRAALAPRGDGSTEESQTFVEVALKCIEEDGARFLHVVLVDVTAREHEFARIDKSERFYRTVVSKSPELITAMTLEGLVRWDSPAAMSALGFSRGEREQHTPEDFHPEDFPRVKGTLDESATKPGVPLHLRYRRRHKDGSWRWLELVCINLSDDPEVGAVLLFRHEVTEEVRTAAFLQVVLDTIDEGIAVVDQSGSFRIWNRAAEAIMRPGARDHHTSFDGNSGLLRMDSGEPIPVEDLPLNRALRGHEVEDELAMVERSANEPVYVSISAHPLSNAEVSFQGAVAVFRDVTQRVEAEGQLVESVARWEALIQGATDLVIEIDEFGVVRHFNHAVSAGEDWRGKRFLDLLSKEASIDVEQALKRVFSGEDVEIEIVGLGNKGKKEWHVAQLSPIRRKGDIRGAVVVARDVTSKKDAEAHIVVSDRMASLGFLASGVAHEINNPLAAVATNLDFMRSELRALNRRNEFRDIEEALADAVLAATRMMAIVADLKIFSRSEAEKVGPVDVAHVLETTLRLADNEIRHRAALKKDLAPVPRVQANESRLGQVVLNLVVNAAQAIAPGAADSNVVTVKTYNAGEDEVVIEVSDTGAGMPPEVQAQLFTPFFTTKKERGGTGLGLSICHRIVTSLGGRIALTSKVGEGTTIRVYLPVAKSASDPVSDAPLKMEASKRASLLVIDDDPLVGKALQRSLAREHNVVVESSAEAALARFRKGESFDVILCDVMMPTMTGPDLHRIVLGERPDLAERFVFITGEAFSSQARDYLEGSTNVRLDKPCNINRLLAIIRERIDSKHDAGT